MDFLFAPMSAEDARVILGWRYDGPYSFYNGPSEPKEEDLAEMLDGSHIAVLNEEGELVGFYGFGAVATVPGGFLAGIYEGDGVLDVGLGLRPDLTGRGLGAAFVTAGIEYAIRTYLPKALRLSVATFNQRAITVYERAGFRRGPTFGSETPAGEAEFVVMTREV